MSTPSFRNVTLGVVGTILTALLIGGWNSKESTAAHAQDITAVRSERRSTVDSIKSDMRAHRVADSARYEQLKEMQLETLCEIKPTSRKCNR
jgi:predicted RNA binding protein with dsRBD fold (UPF0201 family)